MDSEFILGRYKRIKSASEYLTQNAIKSTWGLDVEDCIQLDLNWECLHWGHKNFPNNDTKMRDTNWYTHVNSQLDNLIGPDDWLWGKYVSFGCPDVQPSKRLYFKDAKIARKIRHVLANKEVHNLRACGLG